MAERAGGAAPSDRARMPLLTLITQQSLDEDYLHAAERRTANQVPPPSGRPLLVAAVVVAIFGVLVTTAFLQTSRNADVDSASRATLIGRIEAATDRRARQEERAVTLRERVARLEGSVTELVDDGQTVGLEARRLQVRTGFVAVRGEGVRVTVTERPDADRRQQVKDKDLRLVVNGLFSAGAEAVAVNGQRLAATSAIRTSEGIEVNFVGVAPPYVVEAVGDTRTLPARFAESTTGRVLASTAEVFDFSYTVDMVEELRLPAAPPARRILRWAQVPIGEDPPIERGTS